MTNMRDNPHTALPDLERLRKSKAEYLGTVTARGKDAGIEWARDSTSYEDLICIARLDLNTAPANDRDELGVMAEWLAQQLGIEGQEEELFGEDNPLPTDNHVRAFISGALDYWNAVKHQL